MILTQLNNKKPTIAVLTNLMSTPFSEGIIFGATDYGTAHNYNVLCFAGGSIAKPEQLNMARDKLFDLIDQDSIDGVMLPMGALSRFISLDEQLAFLDRFSKIPVITINSDIPGYLNVGYSPRQGMFELIAHLAEHHGVRKFAYGGATGVHRSTILKKQLFLEALNSYGICFDEQNHITMDMLAGADSPDLERLFSTAKAHWPQAIVAGTDTLAISIISTLKRMGVRVPEDVIVTGSMGHKDSLFSDPPLTTIHEPTYELGWHAAERLIAAIEQRPNQESLNLPTSLLIRRSCGCNKPGEFKANENSSVHVEAILNPELQPAVIQNQLEQVIVAAAPDQRASIPTNTPKRLAEKLIHDLQYSKPDSVISYFHYKLEQTLKSEEFFLWNQLALRLHQLLMKRIATNIAAAAEIKIATELFEVVQNYNNIAGHYREYKAENYASILREIGIELNSDFNPLKISQLLSQRLNITDCYISIFDELNNPRGLVSNVLSMRHGQLLNIADKPYPSAWLMPPEVEPYNQTFALQVMPLSFKGEFLGLFVLNMGERKGVICESLLTLFSSALKNQIHVRNLCEAEKKFRDIAHSASDWLWELDTEARFTYCSDGVEQVLGYKPDELIHKSISDFLAEPNPAYAETLMMKMNSREELIAHEGFYRHKNGHERVLLTTGKPIIRMNKIVGYRGAFKDVSEIKAQEARIKKLAYRDSLSNLPNRTLFNDRLEQILQNAERNLSEFAILFIDLDGFKFVNDSMGHDAGDQLLIEVAKLFKICVHEGDTLARIGGDEFAVVLPNIRNRDDAIGVAQKMQKVLTIPIQIRGQSIFISASIGIAIYPHDGNTAELLLKRADKAMYHSKFNGKNRFSFYQPEHEKATDRFMIVRNLLHQALSNDGFQLVYQPLLNETTNQITGAEALVRLTDPKANAIDPEEFIPLAEEIGLIDHIGYWVFKAACQQQRRWSDSGLDLRCSINVSAKQFSNPNLASDFIDVIDSTGANPSKITIEITENAVINNEETAQNTLQKLSAYGLSIAIDDFGTGYASLSYLRKIPANIIKIDRSFVSDCENNTNIISAVIMMAKSLNLKVIAEGIETPSQQKLLSSLGCHEFQGFLIARPMPEERFIEFIKNRTSTKSLHY